MAQQIPEFDGDFEAVLEYVRFHRGFDFTGYKRASLTRRIAKRMQEAGFANYDAYREHLALNPDEFVALFNTILINVTSFFRDDVAWDFLRTDIVPRIAEARANEQIRVWSTGCATGEEAFSLAMLFAETLGEEEFRRRVKVYATDVDEDALNKGRHASYTLKQLDPVPQEFRDRYFDNVNNSFVFRKDLRRAVIFGRHDLVQDPPISKIDLLVCRNTLMYFDSATQRQILRNFHFALRDDGFLFLGKSEALAARTNLFAAIDLKRRMFAKMPRATRRPRLELDVEPTPVDEIPNDTRIRDAAFDSAPVAHIVIDNDDRLAVVNGQARAFFGLKASDIGKPFKDNEVSFRPVELRSRVQQARNEGHPIALREVDWQLGNETRYVDVQVTPLLSPAGDMVAVGVSFTEVTRYRRLQTALQDSKHETETAYEELQATVEELETTNEELQSTNEELETTNEELQSSNEELETMNEELQSTNEELETMNAELNERTVELNEANAFLDAVLTTIDAGVVVVDGDLEVQAWNEGARDLWGLASDEVVGMNFLNLDIGLPVTNLRQPINDVLTDKRHDGANRVQLAAVNRRGRPVDVLVALAPLKTPAGKTRGVILTMYGVGDGAAGPA